MGETAGEEGQGREGVEGGQIQKLNRISQKYKLDLQDVCAHHYRDGAYKCENLVGNGKACECYMRVTCLTLAAIYCPYQSVMKLHPSMHGGLIVLQ